MHKSILKCIVLASLAMPFSLPVLHAEAPVIPLTHQSNIKAVYQVSDVATFEGVAKGLFYARKLLNAYAAMNISQESVDLTLVYHSKAIPDVLKEGAYQRISGLDGENPNQKIVAELIDKGVKIEICGDTMKQRGIAPKELLPGVRIVPGAYPRLIDLQLSGHAYIKFE